MIFWTNKGGIGRWKLTKVEDQIFHGIVVCTSRVVKMKEHLSFCRELGLLCIEDRVAVDRVV